MTDGVVTAAVPSGTAPVGAGPTEAAPVGAGPTEAGAASAPGPDNPWVRFAWIMPAVWLVFLVHPAIAMVRTPHPVWVRALGLADLAAFGAVFVYGCARCWAETPWPRSRLAYRLFAVLIALVAGQLPVIGLEALGIAPFLVSFLAFTFPIALGLALSAVVWALAVGVPLITGRGSDWVGMLAILGIVTVSTFVTRVSNARGLEYDRAVERLRLSEERERVARDVHDVLGHSLTVVSVKAELAERLLDVDVERARAELADIRSLTRTALAEIRATVGGLRVAVLADEIDAARTALTGAGIEPDLPTDLTVVDPRHRTVLAWMLREAVTNVVRHSDATRCTVRLGPGSLVVEDDGRGLRGGREGNGIRGLRERVAAVGGGLDLAGGPGGRGTRLEVTL
ncbi:sensor histidine kinase [Arsenicicoccus dermatophilus]|uniref:sensor histidine kinase n=1 Tax=Arsenicicoccus dermatophilus TaxID=1076331 RepID=UPI003917309B